ncbi:hypothetical protein RDI58_024609 [Solanum bulbocastanum]|uniref:Uncharacterized protein n=1 Tax=Solanum bulbocastanum TaxID=147425 RepID=A0AAN8T680_SOLBU
MHFPNSREFIDPLLSPSSPKIVLKISTSVLVGVIVKEEQLKATFFLPRIRSKKIDQAWIHYTSYAETSQYRHIILFGRKLKIFLRYERTIQCMTSNREEHDAPSEDKAHPVHDFQQRRT